MSATPGKITSARFSSDGEHWHELDPQHIGSFIDQEIPADCRDAEVSYAAWLSLLGPVQFHFTFYTDIRKLLKLRAAFKLARRKERNRALSKGKHNLKRPK